MATCTFHPDRETLLSCTRCDRPACPDCLEPVAVGQHCVGCTQGRPAAGAKGETSFKVKAVLLGADDDARLRRPGPVFYGLIVLFVGLCVGALFVEPFAGNDAFLLDADYSSVAKAIAVAIVVVGAIIGLTIHEWGHAFVAFRGGDRSVAEKGYLTLDPRHYSDPVLSIAFPLFFLLIGGLPLPGGAVWINHHHLRTKWWDTGVSLAGPTTNVLLALALIGVTATGVFDGHPVVASALLYLAFIEIAIAILNMIPLPGLDGYGAIEPHLPDGLREALAPVRQWSMIILLLLIVNGQVLGFIWDWSLAIMRFFGVDIGLLGLGEELASPKLF